MKRNNEELRRREIKRINRFRMAWSITFSILSAMTIFAAEMLDINSGIFGEGGNLIVVSIVYIFLALVPYTGNIV